MPISQRTFIKLIPLNSWLGAECSLTFPRRGGGLVAMISVNGGAFYIDTQSPGDLSPSERLVVFYLQQPIQ